MSIRKFILLLGLVVTGLTATSLYAQPSGRWYTQDQVNAGKDLFAQNCAICHGKDAGGTKVWKKRDAKGNLPPPPLNGTGHTWHHPMKLLRSIVRDGGAKVGGVMPSFKDKLTDDEIISIFAWIQTKWSEEVYKNWLQVNGPMPAMQKGKSTQKQTLKQLVMGPSKPSPIKGMVQSKVEGHYIYATKNGRYGVIGDLIDLETGENLTDRLRKKDRLDLLEQFKQEDMMVLPAKGKEKARITIFTDTSCPFCRKLHKEVPQLQKAGVTVRYIPFSRGGKSGTGYQDLRSVWCSKDRAAAMNIAKGVKEGVLGFGDCKAANAVDKGYLLGMKIGIRGTPAIVMPDGEFLQGYRPAKDLLKLLQIK